MTKKNNIYMKYELVYANNQNLILLVIIRIDCLIVNLLAQRITSK